LDRLRDENGWFYQLPVFQTDQTPKRGPKVTPTDFQTFWRTLSPKQRARLQRIARRRGISYSAAVEVADNADNPGIRDIVHRLLQRLHGCWPQRKEERNKCKSKS
jgi:hypothetical protein